MSPCELGHTKTTNLAIQTWLIRAWCSVASALPFIAIDFSKKAHNFALLQRCYEWLLTQSR